MFDSHVVQAANHPVDLDDRQVNAVAARIELDLRIGASFTRLQTLELQPLGEKLRDNMISYGTQTRVMRQGSYLTHAQDLVNSPRLALWSTVTGG